INEVDLYNVDCYVVNGETGEQMIEWVKKAMETNSLLVILFHGVDGGNSLNVSLSAHSRLLHFLKENEKDIMIAPMITVAEYIKTWQANNKAARIIQQGTMEFPPIETALVDGEIAFRQHSGRHTTGPNWPTFIK